MCFATVEDLSGTMDVIAFPKVLDKSNAGMQENDVIIVEGKVSLKEDQATLVADTIINANSDEAKDILLQKTKKGFGVYVKFQNFHYLANAGIVFVFKFNFGG